MRTVTNLITPSKHVYVKFNSPALCRQFLLQAEWEGFTAGNGEKPTDIENTDILAVADGKRLCRIGWAGRMLYQADTENVIRVDYEKYINGYKRFLVGGNTRKKRRLICRT